MASSPNSDLIKLSIKAAIARVRRLMEVKRPGFLHGPPGIGKSALTHGLAVELERPLIDVRLSLYDPSDLKGIPHLAPDGSMRWSVPHELPQAGRTRRNEMGFHRQSLIQMDEDQNIIMPESSIREMDELNAILFLDELNSAPQSVQAAAYQLMLDRKIGEYTLPANVAIMAAGNRASDRGVVNKMASPLANRLAHIEIEPVFEDWAEWAGLVGIRSEVIGFLTASRQHWNTFEQNKDNIVFATPRSWDFVSQTLRDQSDQTEAFEIASMYVGQGIGADFTAYRELALKIPDARRIFKGEDIDISGFKINVLYTLTYNLLYGLRDMVTQYGNKDPRVAEATNNTLAWAAKRLQPELAIMMSRLMAGGFGIRINSKETPAFDVFWATIQKYLKK